MTYTYVYSINLENYDFRSRIKWKNNAAILCALKSCVVFSDLFLLFERKKLSRKKILGNFSFCYHYHFICSILYTFTYIVYVDIFCVSSYMYNVYLCENSSNFYLFFTDGTSIARSSKVSFTAPPIPIVWNYSYT